MLFAYGRVQRSPLRRFWRENRWLIITLALALALRLTVLFTQGDRMFLGTDDDNYRESAELLLRSGMLTYAGWPEPTVFIMPGYPILLAGIFALAGSTNWLAARLVQVMLSLLIVWFGFKFGSRLGGKACGLTAGLLLAVYPPNLTAPCFLMTEVVFTVLFMAGLYTFLAAEERHHTGLFILTGLILGLATYFRPTSGPLPFVFGFYLLLRGFPLKKAIYYAGVTGLVMVLCLSPWIARNYIIYKQFIPFTVSGGNPLLRGTYIDGNINEKFPWVKGDRILSDKAQMEYGKKRFIQGFRTDFKGYLKWYTVDKFTDFWSGPYYYKELTYLPAVAVNKFHFVLLLTGAAGLVLGLLRRKPLAILFLLTAGYFTVLHLLYLTGPRYSYPLMPVLIVLAVYVITEILGAATSGSC